MGEDEHNVDFEVKGRLRANAGWMIRDLMLAEPSRAR